MASRSCIAFAAAVLTLACATAAPASASVSRNRADAIAAKVLHTRSATGRVDLYRKPQPVSANTTLGQAGTPAADVTAARFKGGQGKREIDTPLSSRPLGHRAWLYWEDLAPGTMFTHPSVLLAIDARTGHVLRKSKLEWEPVVDGKASMYAVTTTANRIFHKGSPTPRWQPPARLQAAAADGSCVVASGDFGESLTGPNFAAVRAFANGLGPNRYYEGRDFVGIIKAFDSAYANGCRDVVLYLNGNQGTGKLDNAKRWVSGLPSGPYVSLKSVRLGKLVWKTDILTAKDVRTILLAEKNAHPDLDTSVVVEACHSGNWPSTLNPPGSARATDRVLTSVGPDEFSLAPSGGGPSPFLGTLLDATGKVLSGSPDTGIGDAIGMVAPGVQTQVEAEGKMIDDRWPQTPQYESETVTGQVVPPSCTPEDAASGSCSVPNNKVDVHVGLIISTGTDGATDSVQISPPGRTVTPQDPLPSYGNPAVGDLYFFGDPGSRVTLTAKAGPGDFFDGWANTTGGEVCGNQPGDDSTEPTCNVTVTAGGAPAYPLFSVAAVAVFLPCPAPGSISTRAGAVRDCPGVSPPPQPQR